MKVRILVLAALLLTAGCSSPPTTSNVEQDQDQKQVQQVSATNNQQIAVQPTSMPAQPAAQQAKPSQPKPVQSIPKPAVTVIPVVVSRVIDGDTFEAKVDGKTERIRLIGINTPEIHGKIEKYGKEASNYTKKQLEGKKVYLELDVQHRDKYGRLLAYVWMSQPTKIDDRTIREQMFNARLLLNGYAEQMTIPPNVKYADKFTVYVREAREAKRGLWATTSSNQTPKQTQSPKQNQKQTQSSKPRYVKGSGGYNCPPGYPVKGNINSKGEKIYHVPGGQFYDRTKPEYCFCTPADAEAAGFRASKR